MEPNFVMNKTVLFGLSAVILIFGISHNASADLASSMLGSSIVKCSMTKDGIKCTVPNYKDPPSTPTTKTAWNGQSKALPLPPGMLPIKKIKKLASVL